MSQFEERTRSAEERLERLRADQQEILAEAGAHLLEAPDALTDAAAAERAARARELEEQYHATDSLKTRIIAIDERLLKLQEDEAALRDGIRELSQDLDPIYEEIGRIAFNIYRGNPLVDQEYADIFSPMVEVNGEIAGIDAAVNEQQALLDDKPFLEKMVIRGRMALLKSRRTTREGTLKRLIRKAGQAIMKTAFVDEIADPTLSAAAEPFRERVQKTRQHEEELDSVQADRSRLREELESLGVEKRPRKRLDELDAEMEQIRRQLDTERAAIARAVMKDPPAGLAEGVLLLFSRAGDLADQLSEAAGLYERLQAALKVEELERSSQSLGAEIQRKEARQAEIKKQLSALRRQSKAAEAELEAARERRGPVDDLLDGA